MNGRILAERLLATTSVAALAFAMMQAPEARAAGLTIGPGASGPVTNTATVTFVTITGATVTGSVSNSGTVSPNGVSVINGSTINGGIVDSGVIHGGLSVDGSSLVHATNGSAISITSTGTVSGGITNAGRIVGPTTTTHNAIGVSVDGLVQGGITNSGSIVLNTNLVGFAGVFGIDIGNALPTTVTSFGGGISNAGTISVNGQGNGLFFGIFADADTFSGDITNAAGGTIALTANGGGGAALDVAVGLFDGNFVNNGVVSTAVSATGTVHVSAVALGAATMIGAVTNTGTISVNAAATGGAMADAFALLVTTFSGEIINTGTIAGIASSTNGLALAFGLNLSGDTFSGGLSNGGTISANASTSASTGSAAAAVALGFNLSNFSGNIVNSGTIASTATSTDGLAHAHGLSASGAVFSGNLSNSGTISASALVTGSGTRATATAMAVNISTIAGNIVNSGTIAGAATNASGAAFAAGMNVGFTTFTGGITNSASGTISASATGGSAATAIGIQLSGTEFLGVVTNNGTVSASATITGGSGLAIASGLLIAVTNFNASIVNTGTISASASSGGDAFAAGIGVGFIPSFTVSHFAGGVTNSGAVVASAIAGGGAATATGISIHVSTFDGSIVNSGGTISAFASGAAAFARGMGLYDGTYLGGVTNAGSIVASATATGSGFGASANATGILICGCVGPFSNGIVNSGSILTHAQGTTANALGMSLNSTTFLGGVTNSGTITAVANGSGTARAIGIGIGVEDVVSTFAGGVTNTGGIFVSATAGTSAAIAVGIGVRASAFSGNIANSGTIEVMANGTRATVTGIGAAVLSFGGSIVNNGTIAAVASDFGGQAGAVGIGVYGTTSSISLDPFGFESSVASSFSGSIVNNGTIVAMGTGFLAGANGIYVDASTFTGGITNNGSITAVANGTFAAVATGINLGAETFAGDVVNNGAIVVAVDPAAAPASGFGINIHGTFGTLSTASFFGGSVVNMGSIAVVATADSAPAKATGISIAVSTFAGSVVNLGAVAAIASGTTAIAAGLALFEGSYLGGINNSGSIVASATATVGSGVATATGILLCGCVGPFSGGVVNSGAIVVTAQGRNAAKALGTSLNSTTFSGGFTNNGTISAAASARHTAVAVGIGIGLEGPISLFSGGIINTATVSASANATAVNGFATATGIAVFASSLAGNINNSGGTIVAVAQANGTAAAFGLRVATDTAFTGNIINSGTIAATANQGTALGIVATSFAGTIINSGTIAGTVIGAGSGVGIGLVSSAGTIANTGTIEGSTWAINLTHADGANTINQNGGSIIGPTSGTGGAILFSGAGDTLNINGGSIVGNIAGSGGTAPTVNVQPGAGNTFSYADSMSGIGTTNLKSGTLLLQNLATPGVSTVNYNQSAGTTLALEISPAATLNHASLIASGAITLAPGAVLQAFAGPFAWKPGNYTYDALITGGTINGTFVVTSNSPFFVANLSQNGNVAFGCGCVLSEASTGSLSMSVTMLSPSQVPGLTTNQISVANAIINIPNGNATLDQLFTLSNPGPALSQLSAEQFTQTNYQPLVQAWQTFSTSLSDRLSQGGGYGGSASASYDRSHGIQFAQANVPQVAPMSDADTRTLRAAPPRSPNQWGVWTRGYGLSSTAPSTATSTPYSESGAGLIVGADNQITDRIVAGVALNVSTDKANVTGGGFTQTDAYQGSVYGQYQVDANWYLNGIAGFGWQTYKTERVVTLLAPGVNNGGFDGQSYQLYGESGYALHPAFLPQTRITPYLGFGYLHVHNNAFTETGSASALSVQAMDPNSFTTTLGARADATFQIGTTEFRPELRAAWQHEYLDQSATLRAAFVVAPGSLFTATGTGFGRESFLGGAGVTTTITSSTQLFFDYDAKINGSFTSQAVSGGLRAQF